MEKNMWWAYLHANGKVIPKRWFGDHKDYTKDCEDNDFVVKVLQPFECNDRDTALEYATKKLKEERSVQYV